MVGSLKVLLSSESVEWYTPACYVEAAREVMGGIDLDPASCARANVVVRASVYYDVMHDGLSHDWPGKVWLNPPYGRMSGKSRQEVWTSRLLEHYEAGMTEQAVVLVNAATDTAWFQRLWTYPICFVTPRIRFCGPASVKGGPTHGSACVYMGTHVERFIEVFSHFGAVVRRVSSPVPSLWSFVQQEGCW